MNNLVELFTGKNESLKYAFFGTDKKHERNSKELIRRVKEENKAISEIRYNISELLLEKGLLNDCSE